MDVTLDVWFFIQSTRYRAFYGIFDATRISRKKKRILLQRFFIGLRITTLWYEITTSVGKTAGVRVPPVDLPLTNSFLVLNGLIGRKKRKKRGWIKFFQSLKVCASIHSIFYPVNAKLPNRNRRALDKTRMYTSLQLSRLSYMARGCKSKSAMRVSTLSRNDLYWNSSSLHAWWLLRAN